MIKNFNSLYKGFIVNHVAFQEIQCNSDRYNTALYFWTRETTTANAEVAIIIAYLQFAIPVEVKSGAKGSLKSLHEFMERCPHNIAVRLLANTFNVETSKTKLGKPFYILNIPYYLAAKIKEVIAFAIQQEFIKIEVDK
jgi:uncharacterized protein